MKKIFIVFIVAVQCLLWAMHWALYVSVLTYFPETERHHTALWATFGLLSVSFLAANLLVYRFYNPLTRWLYICSAVWLPLMLYLLFASLLTAGLWLLLQIPPAGTAALAGLAALALVAHGVINARIRRVVAVTVTLPNLPPAWKGKVGVLVSDLHFGHVLGERFGRNVAREINALRPDIVFIPGDFYDGVRTDFQACADVFREVSAPQGIYFCSGNHEVYAGLKECEQAIANAGITILDNKLVTKDGLQILGTAYQDAAATARALASLGLDPGKPSVYLKHVPDGLEEAAAAGISLQLSGHTHQAQIYPFRYVTQKLFRGFDYGLKQLGSMRLYTSSGVGTWGPPVRVFTKSEIVKITFQ